ncbi:MAG: low molecular weight protein-tyrosine-phosphatase [Eubacteriales bacterium]|nr:low molecular weight protein-tyrosine-phosphatase [Eubacteriales bacterium]
MIKILFICHGNICRSTMAQFVMQDLVNKAGLNKQFYIDSMATSKEEIGNGPHRGTVQKLKQVGVPVLQHYAKQINAGDYNKFDYIIGMDSFNIRNLNRILNGDPKDKVYKLLSFAKSERDIADPWYTGNFDDTYNDVKEGCIALLDYLRQEYNI